MVVYIHSEAVRTAPQRANAHLHIVRFAHRTSLTLGRSCGTFGVTRKRKEACQQFPCSTV